MKGSLERVRKIVAGEKPDRIPHFDLLPNDSVLRHFNGGAAVECGDDESGIRAIAQATDASRWTYFSPMEEKVEALEDGRKRKVERWTVWDEPLPPVSPAEYAKAARRNLEETRERLRGGPAKNEGNRDEMEKKRMFGGDYYYVGLGASPDLMGVWREYGLEEFCGYLYECGEAVGQRLEANTLSACAWVDGLPEEDPFEMVFIGEDIAFNNGPMFSPSWLEREYLPRLKRIIDRFHLRGKKVLFHSDGNLNLIMDGLVAAGIDGLNPIDINAGMDLKDLHRRYPKLLFFGGINVSGVLPFGTPAQVREAVVRAIEDTEGKILVGSSTEVGNSVPLENYLAMREAAMGYRL